MQQLTDINRALLDMVARWHEGTEVPTTPTEVYDTLDKLHVLHHCLTDMHEFLYDRLHVVSTCQHNWLAKQDGFACMKCGMDAVKPT